MNWMGNMDTFKLYAGIAVKLESDGHKATIVVKLTAVSCRLERACHRKDVWTGFDG